MIGCEHQDESVSRQGTFDLGDGSDETVWPPQCRDPGIEQACEVVVDCGCVDGPRHTWSHVENASGIGEPGHRDGTRRVDPGGHRGPEGFVPEHPASQGAGKCPFIVAFVNFENTSEPR